MTQCSTFLICCPLLNTSEDHFRDISQIYEYMTHVVNENHSMFLKQKLVETKTTVLVRWICKTIFLFHSPRCNLCKSQIYHSNQLYNNINMHYKHIKSRGVNLCTYSSNIGCSSGRYIRDSVYVLFLLKNIDISGRLYVFICVCVSPSF